jgi:enolase-phosphatase E1
VTIELEARGIRGVVLDIEGTTTPISFVYDVLFPYARAHLAEYLRANSDQDEVRDAGRLLADEHARDLTSDDKPPPLAPGASGVALVPYLEWLMDRDRKSPGLKLLQGLIWEQGYASRVLRSTVFGDVPTALERWLEEGIDIAIYSSGSVLAQRLIFANATLGDLTPYIGRYFDTGVGAKRSAESYQRIAEAMGRRPAQLLFVSDVVAELDAARAAGMSTALCVRPGNAAQPPSAHEPIASLEEIA